MNDFTLKGNGSGCKKSKCSCYFSKRFCGDNWWKGVSKIVKFGYCHLWSLKNLYGSITSCCKNKQRTPLYQTNFSRYKTLLFITKRFFQSKGLLNIFLMAPHGQIDSNKILDMVN